MKVKDVPQDLKYYKGTNVRDINYAVDDNGKYTAVFSDGWDAKTEALDVAWEDVKERCAEILSRIRKGETSPLEYHAANNLMDVSLLASYTGMSKRTIKKHFNPKTFAKLDEETLGVYADALRISIEELKTIPE